MPQPAVTFPGLCLLQKKSLILAFYVEVDGSPLLLGHMLTVDTVLLRFGVAQRRGCDPASSGGLSRP